MMIRLFSLILLAITCQKANAQQMYFYFNDASVQVYNLDELSKIDFDADNIRLHLTDQTVVSYNTDLLNYYRYFAEGTTSLEYGANRPDFKLYPNPTENILNLELAFIKASRVKLSVQTMQGVQVVTKEFQVSPQGDLQIDLSTLASGQYVCTIDAEGYLISKTFLKR